MPADTGDDAPLSPTPNRIASSPGASPSNRPVDVVPKANAKSKAAAKGNPKAKAKSKPAAKADPTKVTTRKPSSASRSSASASSGPLRKPAAAKSASSAKGKRNVMKAALLEKIESSHAKVVKPNKPSGYDKMADICKHIVRRMEHEETEDEEDVDLEDEEGRKKRG